MQLNHELLSMALVGYEHKRNELAGKIAEIRTQLGGHNGQPPKRTMSAAARKRIAAAQRRRWRAYHREQGRAA